jgi:polysaccharide biosynthesis/export protein
VFSPFRRTRLLLSICLIASSARFATADQGEEGTIDYHPLIIPLVIYQKYSQDSVYIIDPPDVINIDAPPKFQGIKQMCGDHLVRPDGTITLGTFGSVSVKGLNLAQARSVIISHLSRFLVNPEISLSVSAYNSKCYYVIAEGGGNGTQVLRFPITANETVMDAISQIGVPAVSSMKKVWLARPKNDRDGGYQILPVHWQTITMTGDTDTNYQLLPGDRVYISADPIIGSDGGLARFPSPLERLMNLLLPWTR